VCVLPYMHAWVCLLCARERHTSLPHTTTTTITQACAKKSTTGTRRKGVNRGIYAHAHPKHHHTHTRCQQQRTRARPQGLSFMPAKHQHSSSRVIASGIHTKVALSPPTRPSRTRSTKRARVPVESKERGSHTHIMGVYVCMYECGPPQRHRVEFCPLLSVSPLQLHTPLSSKQHMHLPPPHQHPSLSEGTRLFLQKKPVPSSTHTHGPRDREKLVACVD
jgi:hypothetical protein